MKKSIIALSAAVLLSAGVANAQTDKTNNSKANMEQVQDQKQVEINPEKLPAPIQKALKTDKFEGWKISKAYKVESKSVDNRYKLILSNGKKKAEYKFDENGKVVG